MADEDADPTPVTPSTATTYQFDESGHLVPVRQGSALRGSMTGFYEGRPELTGTPAWGRNWMQLDPHWSKPYRGVGGRQTKQVAGRGQQPVAAEEPPTQAPTAATPSPAAGPAGPGSALRPFARRGTEFTDSRMAPGTAMSPFAGHRLGNVRQGQMASEEIGSQPALMPGRPALPAARQGAMRPGMQFGRMLGAGLMMGATAMPRSWRGGDFDAGTSGSRVPRRPIPPRRGPGAGKVIDTTAR